ncbi:MAG: QueT transporter family protein [Oscillospiraceae bacterium]|jgi:uncharacterized membrane protein|nr:QueT transporter family protein [Oscillospiraceae bacterium]
MKNTSRDRARQIALSAIVGAMYVALTISFAPLSYGPIQFRFAEALCLLPFYAPSTVWGLFVGCLLSNLFSPVGLPDILLGPLATLLAVLVVTRIKSRPLTPLPVIVFNAVIVGSLLTFFYESEPGQSLWALLPFNIATVGLGEAAVCYALGLPLLYALPRIPYFRQLFPGKFTDELTAKKEPV